MMRQQAPGGEYFTGRLTTVRGRQVPQRTKFSSDLVEEAVAAIAGRVRFEHRHSNEQFGELWIDGRMHAYCANAGTALVLAASHLGIEPATLAEITKGLS